MCFSLLAHPDRSEADQAKHDDAELTEVSGSVDISAENASLPALTKSTGLSALDCGIAQLAAVATGRLPVILARDEARRCWLRPGRLDRIFPGLSMAHPRLAVSILQHEQAKVDRFVGRGDVRPIHLRGAMLLARWRRRFGRRETI